ncbi:preprotein translocase subunit SecG [SAR202 cluster bacterium AD-802-E10_MRT_200m]|nr:preprotein translocase subunit SecG [SAR202 cluster bacterium AD-802-E10_MRT_200m]
MESYLGVALILASTLLITTILLQVRGTGSGLFGAAQSTYRVRRGVEKLLFQFTIVLTVIFIVIAIVFVQFVE